MFPVFSFFLSLIGLVFSSYTDLRSRIIPDWIPYSMVVSGLLVAAYESFSTQTILPLAWSAGVTVSVFILAYIFWRLGAWAGGDVKLFTGLAALNPFNPFWVGSFFSFSFVWGGKELLVASALPFFMLNLFILSIFCIIPYSALLSLRALSSRSNRREWVRDSFSSIANALTFACLTLLVLHFLTIFSLPSWLAIILLLVISFFPPLVMKGLAVLFILLAFFSIVPSEGFVHVAIVFVSISLLRSWYGFAHRHVLTTKKKISTLEDGDIPGEWIGLRGGKIVREKPVSFQTIIKALVERDLVLLMSVIRPSGEAWANPQQAAGVYPEQIALLQQAVREGKLDDSILVKASAPFAPAVLLAYILLNILGDGPLAWGLFS